MIFEYWILMTGSNIESNTLRLSGFVGELHTCDHFLNRILRASIWP